MSLYSLGFLTKWRLAFKSVSKVRGQLAASVMEALAVELEFCWRLGRSMFRISEFMYWMDTEKQNLYTVYHRHKLLDSLDTRLRLGFLKQFDFRIVKFILLSWSPLHHSTYNKLDHLALLAHTVCFVEAGKRP